MVYTAAGPHTPGLLSGSRYAALASVSSSSSPPSTTTCTFCSKPGHVELACELYLAAQSAAREQTKKQCKKRRRKRSKAKVAASPIADMVKEFAGNSIITPSPGTNSELWNCDTGATSHMTPHRHWFKTYTPYVTPISLANGQIVYSAGIGSIQFEPVLKGKKARIIEFERVLHVPDLQSNLLAVLYLTSKKGWHVHISSQRMSFSLHGHVLFTATVSQKNCAFLDGTPVVSTDFAAFVSTCPVDLTLWHRRFGHLNTASIQYMINKEMVEGISLQSNLLPDRICEPCLAGKQHRGPIPKIATHRATHALALVHSDVHELPVRNRAGHKYWVTFIDDFSRFWVVRELSHKSDVFQAFKEFKALVENLFECKVKALRDDKGGEYISREFEAFLAAEGIARQHTVRNEPHQNGVAERANRTLAEGITAMLTEAHLPASYWGYALAAMVHIHNRSPTSALTTMTLYECIYEHKPNVSHLRIFGCLAYVNVQKDKRKGLQSHTQKCIFVGYPGQYKGWRFLDLQTRKELISDTAVFDERVFPGNSKQPVVLFTPEDQAPSDPSVVVEFEEPVDLVGVRNHVVAPTPPPPPTQSQLPLTPPPSSCPAPPSRPTQDVPKSASPSHPTSVFQRRHPLRHDGTAPGTHGFQQPTQSASSRQRAPVQEVTLRRSQRQPKPRTDWEASVAPRARQQTTLPAVSSPNRYAPLQQESGSGDKNDDEDNSSSDDESQESELDVESHPSQTPASGPSNTAREPSSISIDPINDDGQDAGYAVELDDGHEDMHEAAMIASLQDGIGYMQSEEVELSFVEALDFVIAEQANLSDSTTDPKTLKEALQRSDADRWYHAALEEVESLIENGTFTVRERKPGDKPIGARWVLRVKRKADGSIERYKGRVVAKGYSQRPGFDYTETFAPTAKWAALRAIFATAALRDMEIESVDISSAFLNGDLQEDITMDVFEGLRDMRQDLFRKGGPKNDSGWVLELNKALYGLKQSPRMWHQKLHSAMTEMGFKLVECDNSIWVFLKGKTRIIVPVYVDDITIAGESKSEVKWVKDELKRRFKLRDLGPVSFLLGVHVTRDRSKRMLSLSQRQAIVDMLKKFDMEDCKPVGTPLDPGSKLSIADSPQTIEDAAVMRSKPYAEAVGTLMYIAIATRPDIAYAVGVLSRFSSNPGVAHWKAVQHLFRYMQATKDLKLTYAPDPSQTDLFTTYCDADFAGNIDNKRSTSGYVVKIGTGAVSWSSRLQSFNTLSTTESEYVAAVAAGQEILWLRNLFMELGFPVDSGLPLCIDNQSALSVAKNPEHHGRMKHLDLRFYWLRGTVHSGLITLRYVPTAEMPADVMTKPLARIKVAEMRGLLGLRV